MSMCLQKWLEAGSDIADALQILINGLTAGVGTGRNLSDLRTTQELTQPRVANSTVSGFERASHGRDGLSADCRTHVEQEYT